MSEHNASLQQQLGDLIADGRITLEDADAMLTFQQFLKESGPPPKLDTESGRRVYPPGHPLHEPEALRQHHARWGPYMRGEADGPVDPPPA
jgi:hypothetical protein